MTSRVKIAFTHDARPYRNADEYENMYFSFPKGEIPNKGDVVRIEGIEHPLGAYYVSHRVCHVAKDGDIEYEIYLKYEGQTT